MKTQLPEPELCCMEKSFDTLNQFLQYRSHVQHHLQSNNFGTNL